jgi:GNAT superfamily N-acetyltransferase
LAALGIVLSEELDVMVLPADSTVRPAAPEIEIVDGLRDLATFEATELVQAAAFGGADPPPKGPARFVEARADSNRHCFLARVDGIAAGAGWATVHEAGVILNGGSVAPRFRGRGVYRALLAARLALARRCGVHGLATQAKLDTSAPILARLGFTTVGRWRMCADNSV